MRTIFVTTIAMLLTAITSGTRAQESLRQAYYDAGVGAVEDGKFDKAERLFRSALAQAESIGKQDALYAAILRMTGTILRTSLT